jgi:hypothetical protein
MIFGKIKLDDVIQVADKVRISASNSFWVQSVDITSVEIKPEASEGFYSAFMATDPEDTSQWFLDWAYATAGSKEITLKITYGLTPTVVEFTKTVLVVTEAEDYLFSTDADLLGYQHDIMKYLPEGRSSWNFVHRTAQAEIITYFDEKGLVNEDGSKITKDQVVDLSEVRALATFKTLRIIYESMSNQPDDFFMKRAEHWEKYEKGAQLRCVTRLDYSKNGQLEKEETGSNLFIIARRT